MIRWYWYDHRTPALPRVSSRLKNRSGQQLAAALRKKKGIGGVSPRKQTLNQICMVMHVTRSSKLMPGLDQQICDTCRQWAPIRLMLDWPDLWAMGCLQLLMCALHRSSVLVLTAAFFHDSSMHSKLIGAQVSLLAHTHLSKQASKHRFRLGCADIALNTGTFPGRSKQEASC